MAPFNAIPYLEKDILQAFSSLKFYSKTYELVKMNPILLAALRCPFALAFVSEDTEDCSVITEFTKSELEEVKTFSTTGQCNMDIAKNVFHSLGIDCEKWRKMDWKNIRVEPDLPIKEEKVEVSGEFDDFFAPDNDLDFDHDYEEEPEPPPPKRTTRKRKKIIDDFDDEEEEEDDWMPPEEEAPRKRGRKKNDEDSDAAAQKRNAKGSSFIRENEHLLLSYIPPKPMEEYKVMPSDHKNKKVNSAVDFDKKFPCDVCGGRFLSEKILESHKTRLHEEHYECTFCNHTFRLDEEEKFRVHLFKHDHKLLISNECVQCGKHFKQPLHYKKHVKFRGEYHDDECAQCTVKLTSYDDYKNHVKYEHNNIWQYKCGYCKELFDNEKDLKAHRDVVHLGKGRKPKPPPKPSTEKVCMHCGKSVVALTAHIRTVHEAVNLNLPCEHCDMIFKNPKALKKHTEWFHKKAPCTECGEMIGIAKMPWHMSSKHTSIYDRKYKCDVCGKGFHEKALLRDHQNTHTGAKPYKCKFCNACFASKGTHGMHQRSHLGHRRSK